MTNLTNNIRKAAVLIRSLDADSAASLLAQLSPEETADVRDAIRALGPLDPDEQADVFAEFRRTAALVAEPAGAGVELELNSTSSHGVADPEISPPNSQPASTGKRFEFLGKTPVAALVPYLAREHAQTIAVVLSYLPPSRAADVLTGLPATVQAETIERLANLGETDPDSLNVVERELGAWVAYRAKGRPGSARRGDALMTILAAADASARDGLIISLKTHKASLAKRLVPLLPARETREDNLSQADNLRRARANAMPAPPKKSPTQSPASSATSVSPNRQPPKLSRPCSPRSFEIDDLARLTTAELAAVLHQVDANVLLLALTGSSEQVLNHIYKQMPRRAAKALRKRMGRLGPTRLSDVATAQSIVAAAAQRFSDRASPAVSKVL